MTDKCVRLTIYSLLGQKFFLRILWQQFNGSTTILWDIHNIHFDIYDYRRDNTRSFIAERRAGIKMNENSTVILSINIIPQ